MGRKKKDEVKLPEKPKVDGPYLVGLKRPVKWKGRWYFIGETLGVTEAERQELQAKKAV